MALGIGAEQCWAFLQGQALARGSFVGKIGGVGEIRPPRGVKLLASNQYSQIVEKMSSRPSRSSETMKVYDYDEEDTMALLLSDEFAAEGRRGEPKIAEVEHIRGGYDRSEPASNGIAFKAGKGRPPLSKEGREGQELLVSSKKRSGSRKSRMNLLLAAQQRQPFRAEDGRNEIEPSQPSLVTPEPMSDGQERIPSGNEPVGKLNRQEWEAMAMTKLRQRRLRQIALAKEKAVVQEAKARAIGGFVTEEAIVALPEKDSSGNWTKLKVRRVNTPPLEKVFKSSSEKIFEAAEGQAQSGLERPGTAHAATVEVGEVMVELGLSERERPLAVYLLSLGLNMRDLMRFADKRRMAFETNPHAAAARVNYLQSIGVRNEDIPKLLVRHPQLLEYSIERTMQQRVAYLMQLGIPEERLGRIVTLCPTLLQHSVETAIKPRVRFLQEVVGISAHDLPAVVCRSPQILTQSIDKSLEPKLKYLQSLGIDFQGISRMITRHPQLLHYSVQESMQPRVDFLRKIGLSKPEVARILVRLSQILCLSVEGNLIPKYEYLVEHLQGDASTIQSFPAFFSLSLEQRIKPRHKFLKAREMLRDGPFPMKFLTQSDDGFCKMVRCSVEEYQVFRHSLMLNDFAQKFGKVSSKTDKAHS